MPRVNGPTLKQKKFVKKYLETGSKKEAAIYAYNISEKGMKWVNGTANTIFNSKGVQEYYLQCLEAQGLTPETSSSYLAKLIKKSAPQGKVSDPRIHLEALKELHKITGVYAAEKKQVEQKTAKVTLDLKGKSQEDLTNTLKDLAEEIKRFNKMVEETNRVHPITELK